MVADILFMVFAAVAVGSALGVVFARNPVSSLLFMVSALASVAGLYVLMEAHFLAAIQVTVYAGAIMVLFMFVIMLLNLGHDYQRDIKGFIGILLGMIVTGSIGGVLLSQLRDPAATQALASFGPGDANAAALAERGAVGAIAHPLFTEWIVPFELVGILLLVAIVGAIVLAKRNVA